MINITLNNGIEMPLLGFGVFQVPDAEECYSAVCDALDVGYRSIDTAAVYGNEEAVGRAIRDSGIVRDELFVTTKLWVQDAGYRATKEAFQRSLDKLQLGYVDLYLIHQPYGNVFGAWEAMQEFYYEGRSRAIGLSNFQPDRVMDIITNSKFVPAVNQIETHPFQQQLKAHSFLKDNNVQLESWGPFAEGRNDIFKNEDLLSIAHQYDKTVAQVILRWLIERAIVAIPKTVRKERMIENFEIFDFSLTAEDIQQIRGLDTAQSLFFDHRDPAMVKMLSETRID